MIIETYYNADYKLSVVIELNINEPYKYIVTRHDGRCVWRDRYISIDSARRRFNDYIKLSNKELENKIRLGEFANK